MSSNTPPTRRTPVYFLGIGGPNFIENTAHPAFARLAAVGKEITTVVKPKAVVVFSAHWQSSSNGSSASSGPGGSGGSGVEVNVAEDAGIIYDFYGFPPHFYEYQYPYRGSPAVAEKVIGKLTEAGVGVKRVKRGLDHGVWAGFLAGKALLLLFFFLPGLLSLFPSPLLPNNQYLLYANKRTRAQLLARLRTPWMCRSCRSRSTGTRTLTSTIAWGLRSRACATRASSSSARGWPSIISGTTGGPLRPTKLCRKFLFLLTPPLFLSSWQNELLPLLLLPVANHAAPTLVTLRLSMMRSGMQWDP